MSSREKVPDLDKKYVLRRWPVVFSLLSQRMRVKTSLKAKRLASSKPFVVFYALLGLAILVGTTAVWSYLGARLQQSNADQLSGPLLFGSTPTFHGAAFPAQHTSLLKWPIYYLIRLAGYSNLSFIIATVVVSTITVLLFAGLLYRIDRRPLMFGTLCLALASCLLLVPAQPYAGGLLPVNMALLPARNLEYVLYIFGLVYIARQPKFNSWRFWVAVICLGLVCASDRLFLDITVGGALLATIVYGMRQRWNLVSLSVNWLLTALFAGGLSLATLWIIDAAQATHIIGQRGTSPYVIIHSAKNAVLAVGYGVSDLFTNFGANPAYDATVVRNFPLDFYHRLISLSGISFAINAVILTYGLIICSKFLRAGLLKNRARTIKPSTSFRLTNMMIWTSLSAMVIFLVSDHYYAVDSAYLTISLFAVFVALAAYSSRKRLQPDKLLLIAIVLCMGMVAAIPQLISAQKAGNQALASINARNHLVADAMVAHHTKTLVGDYWRVLPTELSANNKQQITAFPLQDCAQPNTVLTSATWSPDLHGHRFAYLLSFDKSLTGFTPCNLQQVTHFFGRPNSSELIAGTLAHPTELLLFYDQGLQRPSGGSAPSTILPIPLSQLPFTVCPTPTTMNIVAHEDDDILFINPVIQRDLDAGNCMRSVFLTAGDDGLDFSYWHSREDGIEAAYSEMLKVPQQWVQRVVLLGDQRYATVATPSFDRRVSLIFLHLPDGGVPGNGFATTHEESLAKLRSGRITTIHSIDKQSAYTADQLTAALTDLMNVYQPSVINTQGDPQSMQAQDHSDHVATGKFAEQAYENYEQIQVDNQTAVSFHFFMGYPIRQLAANLSEQDYGAKLMTFLTYSSRDSAVCHESGHCLAGNYDAYLHREYDQAN